MKFKGYWDSNERSNEKRNSTSTRQSREAGERAPERVPEGFRGGYPPLARRLRPGGSGRCWHRGSPRDDEETCHPRQKRTWQIQPRIPAAPTTVALTTQERRLSSNPGESSGRGKGGWSAPAARSRVQRSPERRTANRQILMIVGGGESRAGRAKAACKGGDPPTRKSRKDHVTPRIVPYRVPVPGMQYAVCSMHYLCTTRYPYCVHP